MRFTHEVQRFAIRFHDQDRHSKEDLLSFCASKRAAGLIIFASTQEWLETAKQVGCPVVNVSEAIPDNGFPSVLVNNIHIGNTAAEHLLRKGKRQHVFLHLEHQQFSIGRLEGWRNRLEEEGEKGIVIPYRSFHQIMSVLEGLDRPLAITAATDHLARSVMDRCLNVGWSIPGEVMLLGCSNNELVCDGGLISLSSVPIQGEQVGILAGQLVTRLIDGESPPPAPILVEAGDVERESTNLIDSVEPTIAAAIRFIRTHACDGIRITDVLKATGLSRATLDRQVKRTLGHSPHDEIRRIQLEKACHLLANTHLSLTELARRCGFREPNYFMRVFRESTGKTPTEFRRDLLAKGKYAS